jgi:solute carrier family 24 (sodium/potassium/calcium exchanger), member 6
LAIYGFVIAATWIDMIADNLVDVLSVLGIVFRIPGPIMGLSVLAVGNSVGDLSANMAVARAGLANMAITACFAGPVFNFLIGLGLGFSALQGMTGTKEIPVELPPSLVMGFLFSCINCVLIAVLGLCWGGRLKKEFGYAALVLYTAYAVTSVLV